MTTDTAEKALAPSHYHVARGSAAVLIYAHFDPAWTSVANARIGARACELVVNAIKRS